MNQTDQMTAQVRYKDTEQVFTGSPEQVWLSMTKFFDQFLPAFETANKLVLKVDMQKLVENCEGLVAFAKEGSSLLVPRSVLTDNETLLLWLLADHIGHALGFLQDGAMAKQDLLQRFGKNPKILSTRLGELMKGGMVSKSDDEKYRLTTFGVNQIEKEILSRIRNKITSNRQ